MNIDPVRSLPALPIVRPVHEDEQRRQHHPPAREEREHGAPDEADKPEIDEYA